MRPGVYITVDVECGMGGAWEDHSLSAVPPARGMMGQYGNRQLGVPLITEILRELPKVKADFGLDDILDYIRKRNPGRI